LKIKLCFLLQLDQIEKRLGDQISNDFKEAFSGSGPKQPSTLTQLSEACSVLNVIEPRFKYSHFLNCKKLV
jgi:hypothetical protein